MDPYSQKIIWTLNDYNRENFDTPIHGHTVTCQCKEVIVKTTINGVTMWHIWNQIGLSQERKLIGKWFRLPIPVTQKAQFHLLKIYQAYGYSAPKTNIPTPAIVHPKHLLNREATMTVNYNDMHRQNQMHEFVYHERVIRNPAIMIASERNITTNPETGIEELEQW